MTPWHGLEIPCHLLVWIVHCLVLFVVLRGDGFVCTMSQAEAAVLAFSFANRFDDDASLQKTFANTRQHAGTRLSRDGSLMRPDGSLMAHNTTADVRTSRCAFSFRRYPKYSRCTSRRLCNAGSVVYCHLALIGFLSTTESASSGLLLFISARWAVRDD